MIARDAARATLAAGTARVRQVRFHEGADDVISREEGETEFARRRTRTSVDWPVPPWWEDVFEGLVQRWPWLDDGVSSPGPAAMLYAGSASWFVMGEEYSGQGDGSADALRRRHVDPTWILDVIEHARHEERHGDAHYVFVTDLLETGDAILPPPHPWRRAPRIAGEVRLDEEGRIRRATWRRIDRVRPRGLDPGTVAWTTTELWDFGLPVEIAVPEPERDPPLPVALADLAWRLWRRKRAYERRS